MDKVSRFVQDFEVMFRQDFEVVSQMWSWEQVGEQWLHAAWKLNTFTHTLDDKTYVHSIWEDSINNDDVKNHHHHHFVFSTLVALWWPAAINPCLPRQTEVFVIQIGYLHNQIWCLRKALCLFYAGTLNIKCSMFNVQSSNIRCVTCVGGV